MWICSGRAMWMCSNNGGIKLILELLYVYVQQCKNQIRSWNMLFVVIYVFFFCSQAVVIGDSVYLSGQIGINPEVSSLLQLLVDRYGKQFAITPCKLNSHFSGITVEILHLQLICLCTRSLYMRTCTYNFISSATLCGNIIFFTEVHGVPLAQSHPFQLL